MKDYKCKCKSSNRPESWQTDEPVTLQPPVEHFYNQPTGKPKQPLKPVSIDACIAPVIEHLWSNGVWTINSCCGHNGLFGDDFASPSIIFPENLTAKEATRIAALIAEVDQRDFMLLSWKLTEL